MHLRSCSSNNGHCEHGAAAMARVGPSCALRAIRDPTLLQLRLDLRQLRKRHLDFSALHSARLRLRWRRTCSLLSNTRPAGVISCCEAKAEGADRSQTEPDALRPRIIRRF